MPPQHSDRIVANILRATSNDAVKVLRVGAKLLQRYFSTTTTTLHPFNGLFSRTTWVSRHQKGKTGLDLNGARYGGVWDGSGIMPSTGPYANTCTLLQTDNYTNTSSLDYLQAGCSSWRPSNSVKALKAKASKGTLAQPNEISCINVSVADSRPLLGWLPVSGVGK